MRTDYTNQRDELIQHYTRQLATEDDEQLNGQLNLVSASLRNYLPDIPANKHEELFKQVLLHQKLSALEQRKYEVLDYVQTEGLTEELLQIMKERPLVICSFHTGSYRVINLLLCKHAINYTLVAGSEVIKKEGQLFATLHEALPNAAANELKFIDAEAANCGLHILRELKRGRSVLFYMDGNSGAGGAGEGNDNMIAVDFLQQQLYVRRGIAYLAHAAGVPILPVLCYRKTWEDIRLHFYDRVCPDEKTTREDFSFTATQELYQLAASVITQYPEQWEGWLYMHRWARIIHHNETKETKRCAPSSQIEFNTYNYGLLKIQDVPYVLQRCNYTFYEIDGGLYALLQSSRKKPVDAGVVAASVLQQLHREGVINYV